MLCITFKYSKINLRKSRPRTVKEKINGSTILKDNIFNLILSILSFALLSQKLFPQHNTCVIYFFFKLIKILPTFKFVRGQTMSGRKFKIDLTFYTAGICGGKFSLCFVSSRSRAFALIKICLKSFFSGI